MCNINMPYFMLIEFSTAVLNVCTFIDQIVLKSSAYRLKALVRNSGAHFTRAIYIENKWYYFDDLKAWNNN